MKPRTHRVRSEHKGTGLAQGPGQPRMAGTQEWAHLRLWKGGGPHREAWQGGGQGALLIIVRPGQGWQSEEQLADPQRTGPSSAHSPLCPPWPGPGRSPTLRWLCPLPLLLLPSPSPVRQPSAPSPVSSFLPLPPASCPQLLPGHMAGVAQPLSWREGQECRPSARPGGGGGSRAQEGRGWQLAVAFWKDGWG